jgi:hypothetical protein
VIDRLLLLIAVGVVLGLATVAMLALSGQVRLWWLRRKRP